MGGIGQYFHGEEGSVTEVYWFASEEMLFFAMLLNGDPYRTYTSDYGSDIGIDPAIKPGCTVVYVRLDATCGLWVEKGHEFSPALDEALRRCHENREKYMNRYRYSLKTSGKRWLEELARESGIPVTIQGVERPRPRPTPTHRPSSVSIFLSYSHQDVLLAREFFNSLTKEAKVTTWFDLAQPQGSPTHDREVKEWLQRAIDSSQLFLVLLTRASAASEWVLDEIAWAAEKAEENENFHLLLLNLEGRPLPPVGVAPAFTLNCQGLDLGVILEELYALIDRRPGRSLWREEQRARGWGLSPETARGDAADVETQAGVAENLVLELRFGEIHWVLFYYTSEGVPKKAEGHGLEEVVDPGISKGDRIAFYMHNGIFPVWMRSDDLTLTPNDVMRDYRKVAKPWLP